MEGRRILGRFALEHRIGSGGFGTVYRAWDERLRRRVAVKVIASPAGRRVVREAQAGARLSHPGIVTVYELGADQRHAYLVSELIEGATLGELARDGELTDTAVARIGATAAAALAHAHERGVVHRDVKPHNILVPEGSEEARLADFGVARIGGEESLTATGEVVGTLAYMAPEQAEGARPGAGSDVYSLALSLYECWTGTRPTARPNPAATARAIGEPPPPLAHLRPDLPPELCETVDACLDPDPEMRPAAGRLAGTLAHFARRLGSEPLAPLPRLDEEPAAAERRSPRAPLLGALGIAAATAAALAASAAPLGPEAVAIPVVAATLALLRPRLAFAFAVLALAALLTATGEPGAAAVLVVACAPVLAIPGAGTPILLLPLLAPGLALIGAAALFPALAAVAGRPAQRLLLGISGYLWVALAATATGSSLVPGLTVGAAPAGWTASIGGAMQDVILPVAQPPVLAGAAMWGAAALVLPILVAGRVRVLDALGALIWAACVVAAHRLIAGPGAEDAAVLALALLGAALAVAWRSVGGSLRGPKRRRDVRREPALP